MADRLSRGIFENHEFRLIPYHLRGGLVRYFEDHVPTGSFLAAILQDRLAEAVARADPKSLDSIGAIVGWLNAHAPKTAWGSSEAFSNWVAETPDDRPSNDKRLLPAIPGVKFKVLVEIERCDGRPEVPDGEDESDEYEKVGDPECVGELDDFITAEKVQATIVDAFAPDLSAGNDFPSDRFARCVRMARIWLKQAHDIARQVAAGELDNTTTLSQMDAEPVQMAVSSAIACIREI